MGNLPPVEKIFEKKTIKDNDPKEFEYSPPPKEDACPKTTKEDFLYTPEKENLIGHIRPLQTAEQALFGLFEKITQKEVFELLSKYNTKFSRTFFFSTKRSSFKEVLKYLEKVGILITADEEFCLLQKNEIFFLFSNLNDYITSIQVSIFSDSLQKTLEAGKELEKEFDGLLSKHVITMCINWFYHSNDRTKNYFLKEEINDPFFKEAYPYLNIDEICNGYIESQEPILILIGPPGTGKTRLIRYFLKKVFENSGRVNVSFTSDQKVIEGSEIFIDFLFGDVDVLVIEDIDYHLKSRKDGNVTMYNFLTASNSIVINHFANKKMILSTNLPDVKNIDNALIRPGRCYDVIETRYLNCDEAKELSHVIGQKEEFINKKYTVAEVFNAGSRKRYLNKAGF